MIFICLILAPSLGESVGVHLSPDFQLDWNFTDKPAIEFDFAYSSGEWCAIGLGSSIENTDIIMVVDKGSHLEAWDMFALGTAAPSNDTSYGGRNNLKLTKFSYSDSSMKATIKRDLNTYDDYDLRIFPGITRDLTWSQQQGNALPKLPDLETGFSTRLGNPRSDRKMRKLHEYDYPEHGRLMTIGWLGLIMTSIIFARYFRWTIVGHIIHMVLALAGCLMVLYSGSRAYKVYDQDVTDSKWSDEHLWIGRTTLYMIFGEIILGFLAKIWMIWKQRVLSLMLVRRLHRLIGYGMLVPALINIYNGWGMMDKNTELHTAYVFFGILCGIFGILEIWLRFSHIIKPLAFQPWGKMLNRNDNSRSSRDTLVTQSGLTHIEVLDKIRTKNLKWVFYDEYVLDVSNFIFNHPGGAFMITMSIGEDVGKYMNGCSSINGEISPYWHSQDSRNLINPLVIGRVELCPEFFSVGSGHQERMEWTLANKYMISETTYCLEFSSHQFKVAKEMPKYSWMGKHFRIKYDGVIRYYSLVHVHLGVWSEEVERSGYPAGFRYIPDISSNYSECLRLHIKVYPDGFMSNYTCGLETGSKVELKGPLGPGLGLSMIEGKKYVAFGGGTGVLTFFDLVYAIWNGSTPRNFSFYLYVSFSTKSESFAVELLEATAKKWPENFHLVVYFGRVDVKYQEENPKSWVDYEEFEEFSTYGPSKMSLERLKTWVDLEEVEEFWTCGPSGFNRWIANMVTDAGVSPSRISII